MKKDASLLIRLPDSLKQALREKCKQECLNMNEFLNKLIKESVEMNEVKNIGKNGDLIISNWKEFVVQDTDIKDLEKSLQKEWLDEEGNLVLVEHDEDYRKKFWQEYEFVFFEEILCY